MKLESVKGIFPVSPVGKSSEAQIRNEHKITNVLGYAGIALSAALGMIEAIGMHGESSSLLGLAYCGAASLVSIGYGLNGDRRLRKWEEYNEHFLFTPRIKPWNFLMAGKGIE